MHGSLVAINDRSKPLSQFRLPLASYRVACSIGCQQTSVLRDESIETAGEPPRTAALARFQQSHSALGQRPTSRELGSNEGQPLLSRRALVFRSRIPRRMERRKDGLPLDRCLHGPAPNGRLDPPPRTARRGVLPHPRRPLAELGGGRGSLRGIAPRCRLRPEQLQLAVVELFRIFLPVLSVLQSRGVSEEERSEWELHSQVGAGTGEPAREEHLRTLEGQCCHSQ
mmetsp:Transcript_897/g.2017  ORF Transcript_897/g.2017 Transcript_897/m.2017 type:complete len:226 (+) Transcript_897:986-1663(+)